MADGPFPGASSPSRSRSRVVLPDAVGADDADLVAAHDRGREVADDRSIGVAEADPFRLDDQRARALGLLGLHARGALPLAPLLVGLAHRLERADAPLVAGAAGLDPLADPGLLLGQLLVEERLLLGLGGEQLLAPLQERRVVAGPVVEVAAVELDDPGGQPFQEDAVVGDEDERAAVAQQERSPASGSTRCRGGSSARRAAGCPGSATRARASSTRRFMPEESSANRASGSSPTRERTAWTRWSAPPR